MAGDEDNGNFHPLIKGNSMSSSIVRLPIFIQIRSYSRRASSSVGWGDHPTPKMSEVLKTGGNRAVAPAREASSACRLRHLWLQDRSRLFDDPSGKSAQLQPRLNAYMFLTKRKAQENNPESIRPTCERSLAISPLSQAEIGRQGCGDTDEQRRLEAKAIALFKVR
jgi:hypothetical protein